MDLAHYNSGNDIILVVCHISFVSIVMQKHGEQKIMGYALMMFLSLGGGTNATTSTTASGFASVAACDKAAAAYLKAVQTGAGSNGSHGLPHPTTTEVHICAPCALN